MVNFLGLQVIPVRLGLILAAERDFLPQNFGGTQKSVGKYNEHVFGHF
jgi:hypothetical protein